MTEYDAAPARSSLNRKFWLVPLIILIVLALGFGSYFAYTAYLDDQYITSSQSAAVSQSQSKSQAEFLAKKEVVDAATIYPGITVDGIDLGGKTPAEALAAVQAQQKTLVDSVNLVLRLGDKSWTLSAADINLTDDSAAIVEQAAQIARTSTQATPEEQIIDRFSQIEALKTNPVSLTVTKTYDSQLLAAKVQEIADSLTIEPQPAKATKFNLSTRKFNIVERKAGRQINTQAAIDSLTSLLNGGNYTGTVDIQATQTFIGLTAAELGKNLTLVSKATTQAPKYDPARDNNIRLVCKILTGHIVQPGETFSYNAAVGRRTTARGFKEAGVIDDGVLTKSIGGGICQPNTTLFQAVMKADFPIMERHPHSWPSTYTTVGLDATVSWGGPDFKFKNNSEYPVAIVASYSKPNLTFRIYGRALSDGLKITLKAVHNGYIQEKDPIIKLNRSLKPGTKVEIRAPHTGQRATAYKVYSKNGKVIKTVLAFKSYYRPIQGIYEVGPNPTPAPKPTAKPTEPAVP